MNFKDKTVGEVKKLNEQFKEQNPDVKTVEELLEGPKCKHSGKLEKEHAFETMCQQLGIDHIYTRPYRPQTNGKIEAFNKILKNEFMYPNKFNTIDDLESNLGNFLFEYNHLRKHCGLNYHTPFDKLKTVTELLPNY